VLFTANPLTGKRTETVIDATLGLGEALVSGQVEPDPLCGRDRQRAHLEARPWAPRRLPFRGEQVVERLRSSRMSLSDRHCPTSRSRH